MKTAIVFGCTGLIGGHLVNQLIQDNYYTKIKIFVRSQTSINNEKVEVINIDFNNLGNHKTEITGDDCFFCIGTTKQNSPDKNEYKRIEDFTSRRFVHTDDTCISFIQVAVRDGLMDFHTVIRSSGTNSVFPYDLKFLYYLASTCYNRFNNHCDYVRIRFNLNSAHIVN